MTENNQKSTSKKTSPTKTNQSAIIIAILSTVIVCFIIIFGILLATGVIKFGNGNDSANNNNNTNTSQTNNKTNTTDDDRIVDNTYPRVDINGTHASVEYLDFYLPYAFKASGKNDDGAYTYNLTDDDGWAQVLVYVEKTNLSPEKYLMKISPYLEITDDDYEFNGTDWVQAENANSLAYATKLADKVYAVYYNVKLDSEATGLAMQMIPKTLYMSKIYADD